MSIITTDYEKYIPAEFTYKDTARITVRLGDKDLPTTLNIIITSYTETHKENCYIANTISDSISVYSYGALPVTVDLKGFAVESKQFNDLFDFLNTYKSKYRYRTADSEGKSVTFSYMDTSMNIAITDININHSVAIQGVAEIDLSFVGWNYTCVYESDDEDENVGSGSNNKPKNTDVSVETNG